MTAALDLSGLRDIQVIHPGPWAWFPPALGWWLLALALVAAGIVWHCYADRLRLQLYVAKEIRRIRAIAPPAERLLAWSALCKRVAAHNRQGLAALYGTQWRDYLLDHGMTSKAFAEALTRVVYQDVKSRISPEAEVRQVKCFVSRVL